MRLWRAEGVKSSLPHGLRSIGHCCFELSVFIHLSRQCVWNTWLHSPQTNQARSESKLPVGSRSRRGSSYPTWCGWEGHPGGLRPAGTGYLLSGHPSPGVLQSGQHPSYATRQIPQTSSSSSSDDSSSSPSCRPWFWNGAAPERDVGGLRFHRHSATASNLLTVTFIKNQTS